MLDITMDNKNKRMKITDSEEFFDDYSIDRYRSLAEENKFEKIIVTSGKSNWRHYLRHGFKLEGVIDSYFKGQPAYLLSYFLAKQRAESPTQDEADEILKRVKGDNSKSEKPLLEGFIRVARETDAEELAKIFRTVFATYPSSVHEVNYIKKVMKENVHYKVFVYNGKIISVASAEVDREHLCAEMTDCATLPEFRGYGLMEILIDALEKEMKEQGLITLYSLARAISAGITKVFYRKGYHYRGRMINNCHICGQYEDMNLWVKRIG